MAAKVNPMTKIDLFIVETLSSKHEFADFRERGVLQIKQIGGNKLW